MMIHPIGERQWEDVNWDGKGHRTCINMELGTFCWLLYPGMVTMGGQQQAARTWDHLALKLYADQGTCQDGVAHMFLVSLVDNFQILIVCTLTFEFNSLLQPGILSLGRWH
jgi:hypothetical protein